MAVTRALLVALSLWVAHSSPAFVTMQRALGRGRRLLGGGGRLESTTRGTARLLSMAARRLEYDVVVVGG